MTSGLYPTFQHKHHANSHANGIMMEGWLFHDTLSTLCWNDSSNNNHIILKKLKLLIAQLSEHFYTNDVKE